MSEKEKLIKQFEHLLFEENIRIILEREKRKALEEVAKFLSELEKDKEKETV